MYKLGETITDEFLLDRLRDPFIAFNTAVVPSDNYAQGLYNLAQSGAKIMEAKDEGAEVFDVPREHRHAWETWSNMCVFADRLRAKYGSTVVRKMAGPMWDIRMLDNKLQPNALQSLPTRQLNIAHGAQQLLLLTPSMRNKSGRPPAGNNPSQNRPPNKPNGYWDPKPAWDNKSQPYQGTRPGFNHGNRFQPNRDSLYDRVKARNHDLESRFLKNKRDPQRMPSRVRTPYTPADDKQYKNHLAQVRSDLSSVMLHLGNERGSSQSANLVSKAISTLGTMHSLAVEGDQSADSSKIPLER